MNVEKAVTSAIELGAIQKPDELRRFFNFIKGKPLNTIAEIGTARGGVFYALCQLAPTSATLISIDLCGGQFGGGYSIDDQKRYKKWGKGKQKLHFLREDSHLESTKKKVVKITKGLDLLFIDGDHTYEGVKKDFEIYSPLVKKGGLVVFHDICPHPYVPECQVSKLWSQLKPKHEVIEYIDRRDETWGGIGVIKWGEKKTTPDVAPTGLLLDIGKGPVQKGFTRLEHDLEIFPWPVEDNSVHICVGAHVIEHIKPWLIMKVFDELWRIVKPSGQLALSTPYAGSVGWWSDPTHCSGFNESSFFYLDPERPAYQIHRPKPWRLEKGNPVWKTDGNLEVVLFPIK